MGQQFESSTQVVVHQESGTLPPALDLSRMSVGSAVKDIHTGAWTYPDVASGAKIRAPDGLYRLGNSIVSVITSQGPPASTTKQLFGKDGTKWQNTCTLDMLERAINMQQVEMWKMRARAEAQMEEIAGQMEALTVRAETKAAVSQTGMNRERAMEEAAKRDVPQSKPSKDKESSKFPPQNLITPGLIKPPALMNPIEHRPIDVGMLQSLDALVHPFAQLRAYGYTTSNPTAEEIQAVLAKLHGEETCKRCRSVLP
ncbi:hypothetical protein EV426DRAFT_170333 [Tirmania nivea]|nr:hypothetical protein EV426DRAFT_170333 [Tirmania nivea]